MALNVIFMGTPHFAVPTLSALHEAGQRITAVYTQPPRPAGRRGLELTRSPVHKRAEMLGFEVRTPSSLKTPDAQADFAALKADIAVVVAYGMLLPQVILDAPRFGCINGHASLLPRWRGAAPIQRAVMAGDTETGISVMKMDAGLDTGPVAIEERLPIDTDMTAGELHDALAPLCAREMVRAVALLEQSTLVFTPQPQRGVTYARKIEKAEARIDWARPATEVHNHIRGLSPFPGAWCEIMIGGKLERLKVLNSGLVPGSGQPGTLAGDGLTVYCASGAVRLVRVQKAGAKPVGAEDFLRGVPDTSALRLY